LPVGLDFEGAMVFYQVFCLTAHYPEYVRFFSIKTGKEVLMLAILSSYA
jgi:hypothetical protein